MPARTAATTHPASVDRAFGAAALAVLDLDGLRSLVRELRRRGYRVIAPTMRDGAIVHAEIESADDLPRGWSDKQAPARYRLRPRDDDALFGYAVPAHSWKAQLFPADQLLWRGHRDGDGGFTAETPDTAGAAYALLGVRSCDLHALAIHDRVLGSRELTDPQYVAARAAAFVVAVSCSSPSGTCFCADMGTGPRPDAGFDLALTELLDDGPHRFLVEVGSARGADVLAALPTTTADDDDLAAADRVARDAADLASGRLDPTDLRDLLYDNAEHPRWAEVAERCLACGNCTLVCPTCFCTSVDDVTDLSGEHMERHRTWDTCFNADFSYIHGGNVRASVSSRYRQWATHKLAAWVDQFGTSGCVGCGRCITWCPAAIDITEEVRAIRASAPDRPGR